MIKGVISAINKEKITIRIQCRSACAECVQRHNCLLDTKEKEITATVSDSKNYKVGQEVSLMISKRNIILSLLLAYGMPLFLIFLMLGIGVMNKWSDTKIGSFALLILIPYYIVLFFLNSWLKKHLMIKIIENSVD